MLTGGFKGNAPYSVVLNMLAQIKYDQLQPPRRGEADYDLKMERYKHTRRGRERKQRVDAYRNMINEERERRNAERLDGDDFF
jgi:hypothetical protein